jgi:hypothetical protein
VFKVGFAGKTTDAVFIPADVGARLRPLVTDIYGADGAKSLLNRLAPMVDDQMLQGWILDKGVAVGSGRVVSATAVDACAEAAIATWLKLDTSTEPEEV